VLTAVARVDSGDLSSREGHEPGGIAETVARSAEWTRHQFRLGEEALFGRWHSGKMDRVVDLFDGAEAMELLEAEYVGSKLVG
jgi:hypothetical protein